MYPGNMYIITLMILFMKVNAQFFNMAGLLYPDTRVEKIKIDYYDYKSMNHNKHGYVSYDNDTFYSNKSL